MQTIKIRQVNWSGDEMPRREIPAAVRGRFAIHQRADQLLDGEPLPTCSGYTVTHVPTGTGVNPTRLPLTIHQAKELREFLEGLPISWDFTDPHAFRTTPEYEETRAIVRTFLQERFGWIPSAEIENAGGRAA